MNNETLICESAQRSAEHNHIMIWTVFSVGIALSSWILFNVWTHKHDIGLMHFSMSFLGLIVLFYCILAIESFGQRKDLMYSKFNKNLKLEKFNIEDLPYFRNNWLAEITLCLMFLLYVYLFGYIAINNTLEHFGRGLEHFDWLFFAFSLILLSIILANWIKRPVGDGGNILEEIRKRIFGHIPIRYRDLS